MATMTAHIAYDDNDDTRPIAYIHPASKLSVDTVMSADETSEDGRSPWVWLRLPNGDLFLGVFPQGDTYLDCEEDAAFPFERVDRYIDGHVQRRVDRCRVGDRIDLEDDSIADPQHSHPEFECEFQVLREIERKTPDCIVLHFDNFSCGFPPDHCLTVDGEQVRG